MRRQLTTEIEEFLLKQGKMEDAAHMTNHELEVSMNTHQMQWVLYISISISRHLSGGEY